ncbi:unnamed protein product [Durusdinium trenchii]|uniref:Ion transport domain-containing protein n=1 Tax=Durusdinium trenchii TaxID=1381693 RepID=A0ABP0N173_9DINO
MAATSASEDRIALLKEFYKEMLDFEDYIPSRRKLLRQRAVGMLREDGKKKGSRGPNDQKQDMEIDSQWRLDEEEEEPDEAEEEPEEEEEQELEQEEPEEEQEGAEDEQVEEQQEEQPEGSEEEANDEDKEKMQPNKNEEKTNVEKLRKMNHIERKTTRIEGEEMEGGKQEAKPKENEDGHKPQPKKEKEADTGVRKEEAEEVKEEVEHEEKNERAQRKKHAKEVKEEDVDEKEKALPKEDRSNFKKSSEEDQEKLKKKQKEHTKDAKKDKDKEVKENRYPKKETNEKEEADEKEVKDTEPVATCAAVLVDSDQEEDAVFMDDRGPLIKDEKVPTKEQEEKADSIMKEKATVHKETSEKEESEKTQKAEEKKVNEEKAEKTQKAKGLAKEEKIMNEDKNEEEGVRAKQTRKARKADKEHEEAEDAEKTDEEALLVAAKLAADDDAFVLPQDANVKRGVSIAWSKYAVKMGQGFFRSVQMVLQTEEGGLETDGNVEALRENLYPPHSRFNEELVSRATKAPYRWRHACLTELQEFLSSEKKAGRYHPVISGESTATTVPATEEEVRREINRGRQALGRHALTTPSPKAGTAPADEEKSSQPKRPKLPQRSQSQQILAPEQVEVAGSSSGSKQVATAVKAKAAKPAPPKVEPASEVMTPDTAKAVSECLKRKSTSELVARVAKPARPDPKASSQQADKKCAKAVSEKDPDEEAEESSEDDEKDEKWKKEEERLRAKREAHARYMRFSRSFKSKRTPVEIRSRQFGRRVWMTKSELVQKFGSVTVAEAIISAKEHDEDAKRNQIRETRQYLVWDSEGSEDSEDTVCSELFKAAENGASDSAKKKRKKGKKSKKSSKNKSDKKDKKQKMDKECSEDGAKPSGEEKPAGKQETDEQKRKRELKEAEDAKKKQEKEEAAAKLKAQKEAEKEKNTEFKKDQRKGTQALQKINNYIATATSLEDKLHTMSLGQPNWVESKSVQDAILTEVKPHIVAMRSARNKLQKSYDAAKVGNLERMPEMITEAGEAGTSFQQFGDVSRWCEFILGSLSWDARALGMRLPLCRSHWKFAVTELRGDWEFHRDTWRLLLCEDFQYYGAGTFAEQLDVAYRDFVGLCRVKKKDGTELLTAKAFNGRLILSWLSHTLLVAVLYVIAGFMTISIGQDPITQQIGLDRYFDTIPATMFTAFRCFNGECVTEHGHAIPFMLSERFGLPFQLAYVASYMLVTMGIFNVILAVYVDITMRAAKENDVQTAEAYSRESIRIARTTRELLKRFVAAYHAFIDMAPGRPWCKEASSQPPTDRFTERRRTTVARTLTRGKELFLLVIQDKKIQRLMDELDLPPDRANLPHD